MIKKKWRITLSFILAFVLVFTGLLPGMPIQNTHAVSDPVNFIFDVSEGDITVSAGASAGTLKVTYGAAITTADFPDTQQITIMGTTTNYSATVDTAYRISVDGVTAKIHLSSISINNQYPGACAFEIMNGADVELALTGTNVLSSGSLRAGLEVEVGNTLNIIGTGTLNVSGGYWGAAIGSSQGGTAGTIVFTNGTVNAISGSDAAGIGGGSGGADGAVTIMEAAYVYASAKGAGYKAIQTASGSLEAASTARVLMANLKNTLTVHTTAQLRVKSNNNYIGSVDTQSETSSFAFTAPAETYQIFISGFNLQQHPGGTDFVLPSTSGFTIFNDVEDAPMAPDLVNLVLSASDNYTFVGTTYTYNGVTVPNGVSSITVTPTGVVDIGAITVNNVAVLSGQTSGAIALTAGVQKTITVIENQEGKTRKVYTIYIKRENADQAAPTGLGGVEPSTYGASDGKITGTTTAMEYKPSASGTYTTCSGTEVTGLTAGDYNVRYKAATGLNAGTPANVTVDNGPNADQAAPTGLTGGVTSAYGASDGKITGTTTAMEYKPAASGTYTTCSGTEVTGLAAGDYNVRYKAATGLNAGTPANVTVDNGPNADQAAPTGLTGGATSTYGASDGKITGTTTAMEYKPSASGTYTGCAGTEVTGLAAGDYNVRYKAATGLNAGTPANVTIADGASILTGTVSIIGIAMFDETLTAVLFSTNNTGTLSYQWVRGSANITGATNVTYTLAAADIGEQIKVEITSSIETGKITSASSAAVVKANCATAKGTTPVLSRKTRTSVTLIPTAGYEYIVVANGANVSSGTWQDSNVLDGLANGVTYDFYQRVKATATHNASKVSAKLDVTTNEAAATPAPTATPAPLSTPGISPMPSMTPAPTVTSEPETAAPTMEPQPSSAVGITITPSVIESDKKAGTVTVEISLADLPEGTMAIQLKNGEIISLDGSVTVQLVINEENLDENGMIQIVALDNEEIPIGWYDLKIEESDGQVLVQEAGNGWSGIMSTLLWIIICVLGVGAVILIVLVILRKKREQ